MTNGEHNTLTCLLLLLIVNLMIRQVILVIKIGIIIDRIFLVEGNNSRRGMLSLKSMSLLSNEIQTVLFKNHLQEFVSIISTKFPKSQLKNLFVRNDLTDDFLITNQTNNVSIPEHVKVFQNIPKKIIIDLLFPKLGEPKKFKNKFPNLFCMHKISISNHNDSNNQYSLMVDQPAKIREILVNRIARMLARYESQNRLVKLVDEGDEVVPLILISVNGPGKNDLASIAIVDFVNGLPRFAQMYFPVHAEFPEHAFYQETSNGIFGFEDNNPNPECMICCDDVVNTVLIPCAHASTCESCTNSFRDSKCPICRTLFNMKITIPVKPIPTSRESCPSGQEQSYGNLLD